MDRRSGEGLDREAEAEGEGDGSLLDSGDGVLVIPDSDLWDSDTEIRSGGASGGVLTDTKPGILAKTRARTRTRRRIRLW